MAKRIEMLWGVLMIILAAAASVVFAMMVISGELIMFNRQSVNALVFTLMFPAVVQTAVYIIWFTFNNKSKERNSNKLAKGSLLAWVGSLLLTFVILFSLACLAELWDEGSIFLVVSAATYAVLSMISYIKFRPY